MMRQLRLHRCHLSAVAGVLSLLATAARAEDAVDYAAEDAAYATIRQISQADLPIGSIAFLGLFGQPQRVAIPYRAGLVRLPGLYEFYSRDEQEWSKLTGEIEFGERRADVMDAETIQKFGSVKGVEALLYGDILEAAAQKSGDGQVRLAMTLAQVTTGKLLWTGNVVGEYRIVPPPPALPEPLRKAAVKAAQQAAAELKTAKEKLGLCNVFVMPLQGDQAANVYAARISEILSAELANAADQKVRFFSDPANPADRRMMGRIARDLASPTAAKVTLSAQQTGGIDTRRIEEQLEQLFHNEPLAGTRAPDSGKSQTTVAVAKPALAVLSGQVSQAVIGSTSRVSLNLQIRAMADTGFENRWGANVEGEYRKSFWEVLSDLLARVTLTHVVIGLILVGGLVFFRWFTRSF